jgi:hypothetical protein
MFYFHSCLVPISRKLNNVDFSLLMAIFKREFLSILLISLDISTTVPY